MEVIAELIVKNIDETILFYEQLGFELEYKDGTIWGQMKHGKNRIMFQEHESILNELKEIKQLGNSILLMLKDTKENILKIKQNIETKNMEIVKEMSETDYGTLEMAVKDPNGYIIILSGIDPEN